MSSIIADMISGPSVEKIEFALKQTEFSDQVETLDNNSIKSFDHNDVRKPNFDISDSVINIACGEVKVVNRAMLKALGFDGEFQLFPNLPIELRIKIYELALPESHEEAITIIETATKKRNGVKRTRIVRRFELKPTLPALVKASKEVRDIFYPQDLELLKAGFVIAKVGVSMFSTVTIIDGVSVPGLVSDQKPKLVLGDVLKNGAAIAEIKVLKIDLNNLVNICEWISANLAAMSGLEKVHIRATVGCHTDRRSSQLSVHGFFEDVDEARAEFMPCFKFDEFGEMWGFEAMAQLCKLMQYQPEEQAVMDLWMALNRRLRSKVPFPSKVKVTFRFLPNTPITYSTTGTQ
jgi:hypothetical protein